MHGFFCARLPLEPLREHELATPCRFSVRLMTYTALFSLLTAALYTLFGPENSDSDQVYAGVNLSATSVALVFALTFFTRMICMRVDGLSVDLILESDADVESDADLEASDLEQALLERAIDLRLPRIAPIQVSSEVDSEAWKGMRDLSSNPSSDSEFWLNSRSESPSP